MKLVIGHEDIVYAIHALLVEQFDDVAVGTVRRNKNGELSADVYINGEQPPSGGRRIDGLPDGRYRVEQDLPAEGQSTVIIENEPPV
jgi:hypothetical protein